MERNTFPIDWRDTFTALEPFINGKGGVACVRYAGERCAPNSFVETLTSLYESPTPNTIKLTPEIGWQSLRIDRGNYKVRYLTGIRLEFMRKMKQELPSPITSDQLLGSHYVSSNNVAGHDQRIETHIIYAGDNEVSLQVRRDEWISSLCNKISQFLHNYRFMVILMHGSKDDQQEFWDGLWHGGMSDLVVQGLFLVRMIDSRDIAAGEHPRVAQPDCDISLPQELSLVQRDHAIEDIATFINRWFPSFSEEECKALAFGFVHPHTDDIARLHNKLPGLLLTLQQAVSGIAHD